MAMSMRSRGAAAAARRSRSGLRPIYEDFKPKSEIKQEKDADADILLYHLPGFVKEQIRIIAESKGILRVRGERLISDNKWSRFEEEVIVPKDCNIGAIRAKFEEGVLRIIMPKSYANVAENKQHVVEKQATNSSSPPQPLPTNATQTQQLQDDLGSSSKLPNKLHDENNVGSSSKLPTKLHDGNNVGSSAIVGHDQGILTRNGKKNNNENGDDDDEKQHKKMIVSDQEKGDHGSSYGGTKMGNLGKVTRKLDEDRQLVVNMGVAILVIMALGASISYSLGLDH